MRKSKPFQIALILCLLCSAVLVAVEKGWVQQVLPVRYPQMFFHPVKPTPLLVPPAVSTIQNSFSNVVERVGPAVVNISSVHIEKVQQGEPFQFFFGSPNDFFHQFFGDDGESRPSLRPKEMRTEAMGSGVIIDPAGYILTNNHVIQGAENLTVTLSNDKKYKGKVIGTDSRTDIAVVKINTLASLPYVPLGDSASARIGDWVLAFGSPFGLEHTVTSGIISARRQTLNIEGHDYRNMFQTDAAINRGNSGGPLVDLKGEVIGINTAIYAPTGVFSGVGFAIPVNNAKTILSELIKTGHVERSWMGVEIREVDDVMAKQFNLPSKEGALVNSIVSKSPAEKAGFRRGDVIVEFDGKTVKDAGSLQDMVSETTPKKRVSVKVIRDGKPLTLSMVTDEMPREKELASRENHGNAADVQWMGATFNDISDSLLQKYGQPAGSDMKGVIITNVDPHGMAADAGLMEGDIIREINQKEIDDLADFKKVTKSVHAKAGVVFDLRRQGQPLYLSYKSL